MSGVSDTIVFHESHDKSNTSIARGETADDSNGNLESNNQNLNTTNANNINSMAKSIDNSGSDIILTELIQVDNGRVVQLANATKQVIQRAYEIDG